MTNPVAVNSAEAGHGLLIQALLSRARLFLEPQLADGRLLLHLEPLRHLSLYAMDAAGGVPEPRSPGSPRRAAEP